MLRILWGWCVGFVVITIYGSGKEQFLNLALQRGVDIYDIVRSEVAGEDCIIAKVNHRQIGVLRRISRSVGCRFRLGRRRGLPFCYRYAKKRKTLALGAVCFCLGLALFSNFVLFIEVRPQEKLTYLSENRVAEVAAEHGIRQGAFVPRLDLKSIEKAMVLEIEELSWISIERRGTLIRLNVAEREIYSDEERQATLGAIWANHDALIEEVLIKHGEAMVAPGDTVTKGQLLVSPMADGRADAIVRARVWYQGYGEGELTEQLTTPTGRVSRSLYLLRPNAEGVETSRLKLLGGRTAELSADWQRREEIVTLPMGEVELLVETYELFETSYRTNSEEAAKQLAYQAARHSLEQQIGESNVLLAETVDYEQLEGGVWSATVRWECSEEIGMRNREQQPGGQTSPPTVDENERPADDGTPSEEAPSGEDNAEAEGGEAAA